MPAFPPDFVQPTKAEQHEASASANSWSDEQLGSKADYCDRRHYLIGEMIQDGLSPSQLSQLSSFTYTNSSILSTVLQEQEKRLAQRLPDGFQAPARSEFSDETVLLFLTEEKLNKDFKRFEERGRIIDELTSTHAHFSVLLGQWREINDRCIARFEREIGLRRLLGS